jgi:hypothetical protein
LIVVRECWRGDDGSADNDSIARRCGRRSKLGSTRAMQIIVARLSRRFLLRFLLRLLPSLPHLAASHPSAANPASKRISC